MVGLFLCITNQLFTMRKFSRIARLMWSIDHKVAVRAETLRHDIYHNKRLMWAAS